MNKFVSLNGVAYNVDHIIKVGPALTVTNATTVVFTAAPEITVPIPYRVVMNKLDDWLMPDEVK